MPVADVLVVGSGIAGLSAAIKIAKRFPDRNVCVLTKSAAADSNTQYAQGGISVVADRVNDSLESHIEDTIRAGDGLCNEEVVRMVVSQASERLQDLISYGVRFDRDRDGSLSLGREGGHQHKRIVHCKDATGAGISAALLAQLTTLRNISLLTNHIVIDLLTDENVCHGVLAIDRTTGKLEKFVARATILATGGVGQLYSVTTNPHVATGDGIAVAARAGAKISSMEFIQFHPTALSYPGTNPCFLISEAVRGHGAHLINDLGERFMFKYHPEGELACRDIVARAIATEIQSGDRNEVFLDCTDIAHEFPDKFPNIYQKCSALGLDLYFNPIPVVPAAHYLCGGIEVDLNSKTSIENLYACGECANTGLHGANRLASNSLLEAMVFAHTCYLDIAQRLDKLPIHAPFLDKWDNWIIDPCNSALFDDLKEEIQELMTESVGIVRSNAGLRYASEKLLAMKKELEDPQTNAPCREWYELRNMLDVAILIVDQSLHRTENRGGYYNVDREINSQKDLDIGCTSAIT